MEVNEEEQVVCAVERMHNFNQMVGEKGSGGLDVNWH